MMFSLTSLAVLPSLALALDKRRSRPKADSGFSSASMTPSVSREMTSCGTMSTSRRCSQVYSGNMPMDTLDIVVHGVENAIRFAGEALGVGAEEGVAEGHEEGGADPFVDDTGDEQA